MSPLSQLRALMLERGIDAYLIPSEDQHGSEYISETDKRRAWISGFTGSAGTALVTRDAAHLFTDGRYHQQAAKELSTEWTLQRHGLPDVKNWQEYLLNLPASSKVGLDPTLLAISDYTALLPTLAPLSITLVPTAENLVDIAWGGDKPSRPAEMVFCHEERYAGESTASKIGKVREECRKKKAWGIVASQLDEVAWLLNLRGNDIAFNPVFYAYLVIPLSSHPTLFINIDQLPQDVYDYLMKQNILIEPYDAIEEYLRNVATGLKDDKVIMPAKTNLALASAIGIARIDVSRGPVGDLKAIKNAVELEGFRQAHLRDGIALSRYFSWLERQLDAGTLVTESSGADHLESLRKQLPLFKGLSFPTISSTGAHASIIHYTPDPINSSPIDRNQIYLCDSGAQFSDATTDTTRTMHFGIPTEEEVRSYTRVLQGHIALDTMVFPKGTTGYLLDAFARKSLWEEGLDYRHGTGHGVGSYLNCHEGPHAIGTRISHNDVKLQAGMSVSNEPGCYIDGKYGIRIENIILCKDAVTRHNFGNTGFLAFEHVTMVPIQTKLVDPKLLTPKELSWLNDYNEEVRTKLAKGILESGDVEALAWLDKETRPLTV